VPSFVTLGQVEVLLVSMRAGCLGLNLCTASLVYLCDPWWNPVSVRLCLAVCVCLCACSESAQRVHHGPCLSPSGVPLPYLWPLVWGGQAVEDQAINRVHRLGQTKPVLIKRLVVAGTVETGLLALQVCVFGLPLPLPPNT
jgi:hypothetical protein